MIPNATAALSDLRGSDFSMPWSSTFDGRFNSSKMPRLIGTDQMLPNPIGGGLGLIAGLDTAVRIKDNEDVRHNIKVKPHFPLNFTDDIRRGCPLWGLKVVSGAMPNQRASVSMNGAGATNNATNAVTTHVLNMFLAQMTKDYYYPKPGTANTVHPLGFEPTVEWVRNYWAYIGVCHTDVSERLVRGKTLERVIAVQRQGNYPVLNCWTRDLVAGEYLWFVIKLVDGREPLVYQPMSVHQTQPVVVELGAFGQPNRPFWVPQIVPVVTPVPYLPSEYRVTELDNGEVDFNEPIYVGRVEQNVPNDGAIYTQFKEKHDMDLAQACVNADRAFSAPNVSVYVNV